MQACKLGVVPTLTRIMKHVSHDENSETMDLISSVISICSGPMAAGVRIRELKYQGIKVIAKEGALGDGVGARVWTVAHTLCQSLASDPTIVKSKSVIELGAGCGVCGFLAAKLGAKEVVVTDYVDQLLINLRESLHLNFDRNLAQSEQEQKAGSNEVENDIDQELLNWDPEHADEVENELDILQMMESDDKNGRDNDMSLNEAWESSGVAIRFVDWQDSVEYARNKNGISDSNSFSNKDKDNQLNKESENSSSHAGGSYCALDGLSTRSVAPGVPMDKKFDVVIGTDVLYEWPMATSFPASVAHRLEKGGLALVCCAVRDQEMFDTMVENMSRFGLLAELYSIVPLTEDGGILSLQHDYEGGYRLIIAQHVDCKSTVDLSTIKSILHCGIENDTVI